MRDCLSYFKRLAVDKVRELPPDVEYSTSPDQAAIDNLHRLQQSRPLKPPPRRPDE